MILENTTTNMIFITVIHDPNKHELYIRSDYSIGPKEKIEIEITGLKEVKEDDKK